MGQRLKRWLVWAASVIAAAALVIGNLDHILSISASWFGPAISRYLSPRASISIALDDQVAGFADVFAADAAHETQVIAVGRAQRGTTASLSVPANVLYTIGWQGAGLEAGAAKQVLAVKGESSFQLVRLADEQGQVKLGLRPSKAGEPELPATAPNAKLLISAHQVQSAGVATVGALPELDRAVSVEGLFETGTTNCARQLLFIRGGGGTVPLVGCLGASIPGWLADVIKSLDGGDQHRLDALLGDDAAPMRTYAGQPQTIPDMALLQRAMQHLVATPEFWIEYQARVLVAYGAAADAARSIGMVSERGRLLVFDELVRSGPGSVSRAVASFTKQYHDGAAGQPNDEPTRIRGLSEILKAQHGSGPVTRLTATRIETIVSGQGSVRGVSFDLGQLGISDTQ